MRLPAEYEAVPFPGGCAFARSGAVESVREALETGATLHGWAREQDGVEALAGRGIVRSIPAPVAGPDGRRRWAVRRYRRGGWASFLGDRYARVGRARPLLELRASVEARARGVPTPAVMAGGLYPAGLFYRADLATELVPGARSLADRLFGGPGPAGRTREAADDSTSADAAGLLRLAGRLTRVLETAGVLHADLNARNVLLGNDGGVLAAHVVDLDRCRLVSGGWRHDGSMRSRLERSLRKLGRHHRRPLSGAEWGALRAGFEERP